MFAASPRTHARWQPTQARPLSGSSWFSAASSSPLSNYPSHTPTYTRQPLSPGSATCGYVYYASWLWVLETFRYRLPVTCSVLIACSWTSFSSLFCGCATRPAFSCLHCCWGKLPVMCARLRPLDINQGHCPLRLLLPKWLVCVQNCCLIYITYQFFIAINRSTHIVNYSLLSLYALIHILHPLTITFKYLHPIFLVRFLLQLAKS